ncbi:MAG TPA: DUF3617 domain-containing protein [Stenotrophobium sp.]|jgi:hypothetical protein|nr:DUF3617 domain-containing protein [Stenotrophobium sp.]
MKTTVLLACCALPLTANAATGLKPGKWQITATMDMGKNAPQMPQLSPEQMAAMKQAGIKMPSIGGPHTFTTCVSPEQAASGKPPMSQHDDSGCTVKNLKHDGRNSSGEMDCNGKMKGTGTFEMTADSDTAYTSKFHFEGTAHGHPVDMSNTSTGRWLADSCK